MISKIKNFRINLKYIYLGLTVLTLTTGTIATCLWINKASDATILTQSPTEIKGNTITLRPLEEKYFVDYHTMFSPTVRKDLEFPESIDLTYTLHYLNFLQQKSDAGIMLHYCIFDNKDNRLIGAIQIRDLNDSDPGQLGCWINEAYWGGGRFQEALSLASKTYFQLKPHEKSYIAHVRLWNQRSYHALKKHGFKEIGFFEEGGKPARYILELKRP